MEDGGSSESALTREVRARAHALGFPRVAFARATRLEEEEGKLRSWLAAGFHGSMRWMEDTADVRLDPEAMLPGALSVVVVALPYARAAEAGVGPLPGRVARYARGRDYHNVMQKRLRKLERWLRAEGHDARWSVDSRPVFERAWAERSGLGFIGKNCCLIIPGLGSHVFLGTVITAAPLSPGAAMRERCGRCTRCLDACPTDAFAAPRRLDARRCVSYLTIEHDGPVSSELRSGIGDRVFGCDTCQDVCPYNATKPVAAELTEPFAPAARFTGPEAVDAAALLAMDDVAYRAWATGSPLARPGRLRMQRNAALVLGNVGERRHLPVLRETAQAHEDATVREAAAWAAGRLASREG
ncbi:MAG: tRNA epoxyqueuosine(34) reductase QueG [Myxococcota bacterium]